MKTTNLHSWCTLTSLSLVFSLATAFTHTAQAAEALQYQPAVVTLEGYVDMQQFDGPPNYGDGPDDKKVYVPVLHLDSPIAVNPAPNTPNEDPDSEAESNVTELQILAAKGQVKANGCYRITGTLMHQVIADHYTKVLITLNSAQPSTSCKN